MEKRLLLVLKALAGTLDLSLGDLLEGIVLHAFEAKPPFGRESLAKIEALKRVYGLDLSAAADSHLLVEAPAGRIPAGTGAVKLALGLKAHSGWAALVAVGQRNGELENRRAQPARARRRRAGRRGELGEGALPRSGAPRAGESSRTWSSAASSRRDEWQRAS